MMDALEQHEGTVSIRGRTITNLHFADDIDGLAGSKQGLVSLVEHLDNTLEDEEMEISAPKTKLMAMTNNITGINTDIKIRGEKLETVKEFKHLVVSSLRCRRVPNLKFSPG